MILPEGRRLSSSTPGWAPTTRPATAATVSPTGEIARSGTYRGTKGSELLEKEVLKRLANAKFIPAIHNHQPVVAVFYGTVTFAVVNGKPRLRIFANQQLQETKLKLQQNELQMKDQAIAVHDRERNLYIIGLFPCTTSS